jgi:hypothetical protein
MITEEFINQRMRLIIREKMLICVTTHMVGAEKDTGN